ncbi:MAG: aminotransferase class III-fold pyridoxal phosphate-dependent enzyme [Rhodospirillales bacterium]|nr:aminotransferase class III-fold pyridoxal phosphate-dependent enzyme [Rhodospirillales bacterium]
MNDIPGDIKFLVTAAPQFPDEEARRAARRLFGRDGDVKPLDSDRDRNFRLGNDDGQWVLKFSHPDEDVSVIDFQTRALMHIAGTDPGLPVPHVVPTRKGQPFGRARAPDGRTSIVRLLSWVPGRDLYEVEDTRRLRHSAGAMVGRLDHALAGFFHPAGLHTMLWDIRQAPQLRIHTGELSRKSWQRLANRAFDGFIERVLPRWTHLRAQVIHNDANKANMVVDPDRPDEVTGVIDFGDMIHGPIAAEIAMAADSFAMDAPDPVERMIDVMTGFDSVFPLREDEVDVLFDMTVVRFAIGAAIVARRAAARKGSPDYLPGFDRRAISGIDRMFTIGREAATERFRDALRMPKRCVMGTVDTPEATDLPEQLKRRHRYLGRHLSLFYRNPIHVERGRGAILYDANGRAFVDAYNNVTSVGHCHPHVVNAMHRQASALATNTRYVYAILADYAERLQGTMPGRLQCCILVNSGSEANDIAWQMSTMLTGKRGGIVMEHAYHGITEATVAMSPAGIDWNAPDHAGKVAPHIATMIAPDTYRGPYRRGEKGLADKYAADADRAIAQLDASGHGTACLMVDTSFCSNGIPDVPKGYLGKVAARVRAAGGMIVADEVQYGFGRPGTHMWGFEYHGIRPDIVTIGKPVGDGFPLGVVVTTPQILHDYMEVTGLFSTFGGNPVACAAGLAVLDVLEREDLLANCRITGNHMKAGLTELMGRHECIGDVRGHGFVIGVEIVGNRVTLEPDAPMTTAIMNRMRELGVLVGREGHHGNVFKIRPPMVFSRDNADSLVTAMDQAINELTATN